MTAPTKIRTNPKKGTFASRRRILDVLKRNGERDAESLAHELGISGMAVRQHLYQMQEEQWVVYRELASGRGRPRRLWKLTPVASRFFPDRHKELILDLLDNVQAEFGEKGISSLLQKRIRNQVEQYSRQLNGYMSLEERIVGLADIRSEEGYLADVETLPDGNWLLVENHCPICEAATACRGLCDAELEIFRQVLGPDACIERVEHLLEGQRRCAYRIEPTGKNSGSA